MIERPILCVGEALIDVVIRGDEQEEHVGGSPLNVASGLAALGHPTLLASWWAPDERGHAIERYAAAHHVGIVPGSAGAQKTTVAYAHLDALGQARYCFDLEWNCPQLPPLESVAHMHIGSYGATTEPGATHVGAAVAHMAGTISYDPNARPAIMGSAESVRDRIERLISLSDVVKASDEDVAWLYGDQRLDDVMQLWLGMGVSLVVITRGKEGARAMLSSQPGTVDIAPFQVEVADTVGAGDSFMAGLLSGLADAGLIGGAQAKSALRVATWDQVKPALTRGTVTSSITVSQPGAYSPNRHEVSAALARSE
ncbi:MAG: PfkB family carbohydrate kinase [Ancrocorticia sp.]|nr:PfkB family carbohydrate kinase [Ancrocorticia sp.]